MTDASIAAQLPLWPAALWPPKKPAKSRDLHVFWHAPERLPAFVRDCPTSRRYLDLLGPLPWTELPVVSQRSQLLAVRSQCLYFILLSYGR